MQYDYRMKAIDERLNWGNELWKGSVLVATSRSGVTEDIRLSDGALVEVHHFKSGRVACQTVSTINDSLTVRPESDYLQYHSHPTNFWIRL